MTIVVGYDAVEISLAVSVTVTGDGIVVVSVDVVGSVEEGKFVFSGKLEPADTVPFSKSKKLNLIRQNSKTV